MTGQQTPLILDTDIGGDIDDLYALYLALLHPGLALMGVTTAYGDTQGKARLVEKALRVVGRTDIPVGAGTAISQTRLDRGDRLSDPGFGTTYLEFVTETDPEHSKTYPSGPDLILNLLSEASEPVALASIGAFSNIAEVIDRASPAQRQRIRCIALMGGETEAVMSEFNVHCDPEAADTVLASGLPVFLGTWSVTRQLVLTMEEVERHLARSGNPMHQALHQCTHMWAPHRGSKPGPVLYDLVPLFWLADESCVTTRPSNLRVELDGRYTRGQTVRVPHEGQGPVLESVALDGPALVQAFLRMAGCEPEK
jgi:inosine-uridine nucleoside N-ribohydrolase